MKRIFYYQSILILLILFVVFINSSCSRNQGTIEQTNQNNRAELRQFTISDNKPAELWEHAYPVGNGRLGAMPFGGFPNEQILLNEETIWQGRNSMQNRTDLNFIVEDVRQLLWAGEYEKAQEMINKDLLVPRITPRAYQPLGYLRLKYKSIPEKEVLQNYSRELSLNDALAFTKFETAGGNLIKQEVFSSHPDDVIVIRIKSQEKHALSIAIDMDRFAEFKTEILDNNMLVMSGQAQNSNTEGIILSEETTGKNRGTRFHAVAKVLNEGGETLNEGNSIVINNANSITILIASSTDYNYHNPFLNLKHNRLEICLNTLSKAEKYSYTDLKRRHIEDHQSYFNRASINLGDTPAEIQELTTPERLEVFNKGGNDPDLIEDLFQMGRYMLIASSREGTLPPNLTGIWNGNPNPHCHSDWHTNINVQENYWHAELTNLSDLHEPFITLIDDFRKGQGKQLAEKLGCRGFLITHATTAWKEAAFSGLAWWGMWPMGGAWSVSHVMEHYRFTRDKEYLTKTAYPILRDNVLFCLDWLVENPETGKLVSGPSTSPENGFYVDGSNEIINACMGPTIDQMIIYQSFTDFMKASEILDINNELTSQIEEAREKLSKPQIGSDGRIMEWDKEYREWKVNHRHYSHLYALYPGCEITQEKTPGLFEAARKSIEMRQVNGGAVEGWSRAHVLNLYARLNEGDKAFSTIRFLLKNNTLPNLMHTQKPIFFDGNAAGTAGIAEMLLQSHKGYIELLPALPSEWAEGFFSGLCARGNFVIDLEWKNHELNYCIILSRSGGKLKIKDEGMKVFCNGKNIEVHQDNSSWMSIETIAGNTYELRKDE